MSGVHERDGALFAHGVAGATAPAEEVSEEAWAHALAINLSGCFHGLAESSFVSGQITHLSSGRTIA